MLKAEAVQEFKEQYADLIANKKDKPAVRMAWNDFKDMLRRNEDITAHQLATWSNPIKWAE